MDPPKKEEGWKDEGYYVFSSTLATDGLGSGLRVWRNENLSGGELI
jgi:hypothetical protein